MPWAPASKTTRRIGAISFDVAFLEAVEAKPDQIRGNTTLLLHRPSAALLFTNHQLPSLFGRTVLPRSHYQRGKLFTTCRLGGDHLGVGSARRAEWQRARRAAAMKLVGAGCLGGAAAGLDVSLTTMGAFPLSLDKQGGEGERPTSEDEEDEGVKLSHAGS
jgi:hypothetical protein